jgi:hypothetical protein
MDSPEWLPGVPGRIRTCGLSVRSAALYPLSYEDAYHTLNYSTHVERQQITP